MHLGIDEERFCLGLRGALRQRHRFRRSGGLVEQRGVGDIEPGEVADHGLEIEQGFQPALADLRLIRRIGRVPGRVLQDVALDHRRQDGSRIALADQRGEHLVLRRQLAHMRQRFGFAQGGAEIERRLLPDRGWQGFGHQRAKAFRAHGLQHRADVAGRGADVAAHEGGGGLVGVFKRRVHGVVLAVSSCPAKAGHPVIAGSQRLNRSCRGVLDRPPFKRTMTAVGRLVCLFISRSCHLTRCAWRKRPRPSGRRVRSCRISST